MNTVSYCESMPRFLAAGKSVTNINCRKMVANFLPFPGNNIEGGWVSSTLYVVYSYSAHYPMFLFDSETSKWYENEDKYSRTTSKHHGQARPVPDCEPASTQWLREKIRASR